MPRPGTLAPVLRSALASRGGKCYRHCDRPIETRGVASPLPGLWQVHACPSGVVSVTSYAERTRRDPTKAVRTVLRAWSVPPRLVRSWDLRLATRHGPELGRAAERFLGSTGPRRGVRVVYWRVYPTRGRDGIERRLFVCFRRRHKTPVFFVAPSTSRAAACPVCGPRERPGATAAGTYRDD